MDEPTDPLVAKEELFERSRRFLDEWLIRIRDQGAVCRSTTDCSSEATRCLKLVLELPRYDTAIHLCDSSNKAFQKVMVTFSYLCHTIWTCQLEAESRFYPTLLLFGEGIDSSNGAAEGDMQKAFATVLPLLCDLLAFVSLLQRCCLTLMLNMGALAAAQTKKNTILQAAFLSTPLHWLGVGLSCMLTLDLIVNRNPSLASALALYRRMLQAVNSHPDQFQSSSVELERLEDSVAQLEAILSSSGIFTKFVRQQCRQSLVLDACDDKHWAPVMAGLIKSELSSLLSQLSCTPLTPPDQSRMLGVLSCFVAYCWMVPDAVDRKLLRMFLDLHSQVPLLCAYADITLQPAYVMSTSIPNSVFQSAAHKDYARQVSTARSAYIAASPARHASELHHLCLGAAAWMSDMEALMAPQRSDEGHLSQLVRMLSKGVALAGALKCCVCHTLALHTTAATAIKREEVRHLIHALSLLKGIHAAYTRHHSHIFDALPHLVTHVKSTMQTLVSSLMRAVQPRVSHGSTSGGVLQLLRGATSREGSTTAANDTHTVLHLINNLLDGPASRMHGVLLSLCVDALEATKHLPPGEVSRVSVLVRKLMMMVELQRWWEEAVDCSFLYVFSDLFPTALGEVLHRPEAATQVPYLVSAFSDCCDLLSYVTPANQQAAKAFEKQLYVSLEDHFLQPVSMAIENDLRVISHHVVVGTVEMGDKGEMHTGMPQAQRPHLQALLQLQPIRVVSRIVDIKQYVEHWLRSSFYNHTAVGLHDFNVYAAMASAAQRVYGLSVQQPDLPGKDLEQGTSLLDIIFDMPTFVSCYAYDLQTQLFIQRASCAVAAKQLHTISMWQVASTLRMLGCGVTTKIFHAAHVAITQLMVVLLQTLGDERVSALLIREARFFNSSKNELNSRYPVQRARELVGDIGKIVVHHVTAPLPDYLRSMITEIGNALGLLRMTRQAVMHLMNMAPQGMALHHKHAKLDKKAALLPQATPQLREAVQITDSLMDTMKNMSLKDPDYLVALVHLVATNTSLVASEHLRGLHMLLPALTINYLDTMLLAKEKLTRHGSDSCDGLFCDDGFPMGCAFLLKVLQQDVQFDSLQWFDSAQSYFQAEHKAVAERTTSSSPADDQNIALMAQRVDKYKQEFKLLEHSLAGCRMFFSQA